MRIALIFAVVVSIAGCSSTGGLLGRNSNAVAAASDDPSGGAANVAIASDGLAVYLEMMRALIEGDALTQAETFRGAQDSVNFAPTTTNRLKYALALAIPGHQGSDAVEAQRRLSALLAASNALLPEERVLATIQLRDTEQRVVLAVTSAELRAELAAARETENTESSLRIQSLIDDNRRLQAELDDALAKLDAITTIEQSLRELENGAN